MNDLKQRTVRGGFARLFAQGATFVIRAGSLMILARLLSPAEFGLVGMVTAFTGLMNLFRDFGLSAAAVQRKNISEQQLSVLFWINIFVGALLSLLTFTMAPLIADFYHEPRLTAVTEALATAFIFNGAGVQHSALLQRQMRFTALALIGVVSLLTSTVIAIVVARMGFGYWALVLMTTSAPLIATIGFWLTTGWIPGVPTRGTGLRSLMGFGGTVTLNGLVAYIAYNFEKVLLGRFWGAGPIGMYGRAYQLVSIPTDNLNSAVGEVAFSALSRLQDDPPRLKSYFVKGYSLVLTMTLPITIACGLFADDAIAVLLGAKWNETIPILRFLAPTILIFALINPLGWLMLSLGLVRRSLKLALIFAPTIIAGYFIGLPYGPKGIAFAYSAVMALWVFPFIKYCVRGTGVSLADILGAVSRPLGFGVCAGVLSFGARLICGQSLSPLPRLIFETMVLGSAFVGMLVFIGGQKSFYIELFDQLMGRAAVKKKGFASA